MAEIYIPVYEQYTLTIKEAGLLFPHRGKQAAQISRGKSGCAVADPERQPHPD